MTIDEVRETVVANAGKTLRITFSDGIVHSLVIGAVDNEGFLHSGENGTDPQRWWSRFESVKLIER
jgi:hypothetical protein